ncbi:MAG: putative Ig domain-containing protein [Maricaulaceae bacterium]
MIDPIDVSAAFEDIDGDTLSFSSEGLPPGLTIDPVTGIISGTLDNSASFDGPYNVTIMATDADGAFISTNFVWTVNNIAPEVTGTLELVNLTTVDAANITTATAFTDPDGDELTFSAEGLPEGLTIDPDSGVISGVAFEEGVFMVTVTTDDGEGGQAEIALTLDVLQNGFIDVDPAPGALASERPDSYEWVGQQSIALREFFAENSLRQDIFGTDSAGDIDYSPRLGGMFASQISGLGLDEAYIVVEAVVRDHVVNVQLISTLESFHNVKVQDWDVRLGSGQSLPEGVNLQGDMIYIDRNVTRESVDLRVRAILDNGRAVTIRATIDLATGTITETGSASLALTSFTDQLAMSEDVISVEMDKLVRALG